MITSEQAARLDERLRAEGGGWTPVPGDRFVIPGSDLTDVFVVADMTIEVHDLPTGRLIRFNGTTEWALDSISADRVRWLPWEHQLRDLLGDRFSRLERLAPVEGGSSGYAVVLADGTRHVDVDADAAYLRALLG